MLLRGVVNCKPCYSRCKDWAAEPGGHGNRPLCHTWKVMKNGVNGRDAVLNGVQAVRMQIPSSILSRLDDEIDKEKEAGMFS